MKKKTKSLRPIKTIPDYFRWSLMVAVIGTPFFSLYGQWFGYLPELHMMSWLAVISLLFGGIFCCLYSNRIQATNGALWIPFGALLIWLSLTVIWAINFYEALFEWMQWLSVAMLGWLLYQCVSKKAHLIQLLQLLYGASVLTAIIGIGQHWGLIEWIQQGAPPAATFFNRNIANQFIVFSFPVGLVLLHYLPSKSAQSKGGQDKRSQSKQSLGRLLQGKEKQWLYGLGLSLIAAYVFYTGTRAAALAMIVQLIVWLLWLCWDWQQSRAKSLLPILKTGQQWQILWVAAIVWLLLIHIDANGIKPDALKSYVYRIDISDLSADGGQAINSFTQDSGRSPLWLNTLIMVKDHALIGVGLGNWSVVYPLYHQVWLDDSKFSMVSSPTNTHNDFLQYAAELGLVGIILLLWLLGRYLMICYSAIKRDSQQLEGLIALGAVLAILGLVVDANFSFPLQMPMPKMLLLIWLVIVSNLLPYSKLALSPTDASNLASKDKANISNNRNQPAKVLTIALTRLSPIFGIAFLIGCVFMFQWQQRWYLAEVANRKATADKRYERYETMHANALESYQLNPMRKRLLHFVALGHELKGETTQALQAYRQQLQDYPYLLYAMYQSMQLYVKIGEYQQAKQMLEQYISIRPTEALVYKSLAVIEMQHLKQLDQALPHFRKALELDPNIEDASEIRRLLSTYPQAKK